MRNTLSEHASRLLVVGEREALRNRRLVIIFSAFSLFCAFIALIFYALGDSVSYYKTPSSLSQSDREAGSRLRLGGIVVAGSLEQHGSEMSFLLSDDVAAEKIHFQGIVPDLFREGQAVIVEGKFEEKAGFVAYRLLAKHDARYISPERVEMLKKQGKWQEYLQK